MNVFKGCKSLKKIFDDVEAYPTFVYYETEWETLRQKVDEKIKEEADKLSKLVGEPKLNVSAEYVSFNKDLNIIEVNFNFKNESILNLDNVEILSITTDPKYLKPVDYDGITKNFYLYHNSPSKNISLKFKVISDSIWSEFELSFNIKMSYTYRNVYYKSIRNDDNDYSPLTINLNDIKNFEEIDNPFEKYSDGTEVKDRKMFYGRDDYIDSILSLIINDKEHSGKCLAIYGQTRTGKSSLLNFLQKELRNKDKDDIIVSFGNIDKLSKNGKVDLKAFLVRTLRLLDDEIKKNHSKLLSLLKENGISIDVDKIKDDDLLMENFDCQFGKICEFIHSMNKQIIFTIDEFTSIYDLIRKGTMTDDFMKFWKAFIQDYSVFAILICQDHMMYFVNDLRFTNAFSTTELKRITYLEEKYAKKLMYEPILDDEDNSRYTDEALDYLYNLTSGRAYLIMKLCAGLVDYLNEIRNPKITKNIIEEYLRKNIMKFGENIFEPQYYDKSSDIKEQFRIAEENKKIIREIAKNSDKDGWLYINISAISEEEKKLLDKLESRYVLIKKDGKYKIKVDLYRQWILAKEGKNNN